MRKKSLLGLINVSKKNEHIQREAEESSKYKIDNLSRSPLAEKVKEPPVQDTEKQISNLTLNLKVPVGQIFNVVGVTNYLNFKFDRCEVKVTIVAKEGKLSQSEYEDKIMEALMQAGIKIIEQDKG